MSYNILAEMLKRFNTPFDNTRGKRISDAILNDKADIVCLQEVDTIKNELSINELEQFYNASHVDRRNFGPDGISILYNKYRFKIIQQKHVYLDDESEKYSEYFDADTIFRFKVAKRIFQLIIFEDLDNDRKPLCVCNTHFFHQPTHDDTKYMQMVLHFNIATKYVNDFDLQANNKAMTPIIFVGDYNTTPKSNAAHIHEFKEPNMDRIEPIFKEQYGEMFLKTQK